MKLSVVICTYNRAHLLERTLASVAAQTDQDFELVIVDDGSVDDTERLVAALAPRFRNCRYVKKTHGGIADARNVGVTSAGGTHVCFLDADDLWGPPYVEAVRREFARMPELELLACNGIMVEASSGAIVGRFFPGPIERGPWRARTVEQVFSFFPYVGSTVCFTRALYDRTGPFRGYPTAWEDWNWIIRALDAGATCAILEEPFFINRHHAASLTARVDDELRGWMLSYEDLWGASNDPDVRRHAWRIVAPRLFGALARCSPATNRSLLGEARRLFGHRWLLTPALALTYCGLCRAARLGVRSGRLVWPRRTIGHVDLDAPPVELFEAILRFVDAPVASPPH